MVTQHYYPDSEERFYECVLCSDAIYNPLCQECLSIQISSWASTYPKLGPRLKTKMMKFIQAIDGGTTEGLNCVACKTKRASVCPYCFSEFVLGQLKKLNAPKVMLQEFVRHFNYDYDGEGYAGKEAADFGII